MIPIVITGALVLGSILCGLLARALRERDQARIALGIARMELLDVRVRLADTHRRVVELERQADRPVTVVSARMGTGHPMANVAGGLR